MISRYSAVLNGVSLASISTDILLLDIRHSDPEFSDTTYRTANKPGAMFDSRHFDRASVAIEFEIRNQSIAGRQGICNAVVAWAKKGGVLKTNDMGGQFLQCICSKYPTIDSAKQWTNPLTIEFEAIEVPFWQAENATTVEMSAGTSGTATALIPGNVDGAFVSAEIEANATLSSVTLGVNGRSLTISGLSVSSGSTIVISYDERGIQSIKVGNTSLLDKRTGVDDLLANCGEQNTFTFSSSASVNVTFSVRGWWL